MPEQHHPLIDVTGMHAGTYRVGDDNLLHAVRQPDGTYVIDPVWPVPACQDSVRTLLDYLTGPHHLHLHILRYGRCANEDHVLYCKHLTAHTQADPQDHEQWSQFIRGLAQAWLTAHRAEPGHYYAHAADLDARSCAGPWGRISLGHTEIHLP